MLRVERMTHITKVYYNKQHCAKVLDILLYSGFYRPEIKYYPKRGNLAIYSFCIRFSFKIKSTSGF